MFFLMEVSSGQKELDFSQTAICAKCGRYGRYQVYMTFLALYLFFIPCFRWNRHYYVKMSCCDTVYEIDKELGKRIAKGEDVVLTDADLTLVQGGWNFGENSGYGRMKRCSICGYTTEEDFDFCPKCGNKL